MSAQDKPKKPKTTSGRLTTQPMTAAEREMFVYDYQSVEPPKTYFSWTSTTREQAKQEAKQEAANRARQKRDKQDQAKDAEAFKAHQAAKAGYEASYYASDAREFGEVNHTYVPGSWTDGMFGDPRLQPTTQDSNSGNKPAGPK